MPRLFKPKTFDLKGYLALLPQFRRLHTSRPALVLPWVRDGLEDWTSALAKGNRIVNVMTSFERSDPESIDLCAKQRISSESGENIEVIDGLLCHFVSVRAQVRRIEMMSFWQRLSYGWKIARIVKDSWFRSVTHVDRARGLGPLDEEARR